MLNLKVLKVPLLRSLTAKNVSKAGLNVLIVIYNKITKRKISLKVNNNTNLKLM